MKLNTAAKILASVIMIFISLNGYACTLFTANVNGNILVGRNLDWKVDDGVVWIQPQEKNKYGIIIFEQYGGDLPFEGMNSEGLFIGENAVPDSAMPFSFGKPFVRSLKIIKMILEQCATVEEALEIFPKYNIIFATFWGYPQVHYMIADKTGNSAIVEFFDNKMRVFKKSKNDKYQLMTNFYIAGPDNTKQRENSRIGGYDRFAIAKMDLDQMTYPTVDFFKQILEACYNQIYPTIWSNVYDLKKMEIHTCFRREFTKCKTFDYSEELKKGRRHYNLSDLFP